MLKRLQNIVAVSLLSLPTLQAQDTIVPIAYGDMDQWITRKIHESGIIGGQVKTLYEIAPTKTIEGNLPYTNQGNSPWGTSNVMAKVAGIVKTNTTVYKEPRGEGFCAKMETHIEKVKVLGLVNINVLAAGSIFLGDMAEPIRGTKEGLEAFNWGIPFTKRPKSLVYDYKVKLLNDKQRIKLTGFGGSQKVDGPDCAITYLFLQKRVEDKQGRLFAKRVGTLVVKYEVSSEGWVNGASYEIHYGDITKRSDYDAETMGLRDMDYATNSKGQNVPVKEIGWASEDEEPTHLLLQFSSSHGGAFIGTPGNTLWIDNVGLGY